MGFALAPDFGGAMHVCVQCSSDTELVQRYSCVAVHSWHKDGPGHTGLGVDLREEPLHVKTVNKVVYSIAHVSPMPCVPR